MRGPFKMLAVLLTLLASCSEDRDKQSYAYKELSFKKEFSEEVKQAREIFRYLYLPVEMSDMFEKINEGFNPTLLQDLNNIDKIVFSNEIALAMGVYGVNLGYIRLFEQWNLANDYFVSIKNLSEKVGVTADVFNNLSAYFEKPVYNRDTLEMYANEVYILTDYSLRQNGRDNTSALIIVGGWLEALRMGIKMLGETNNAILLAEICKQINSLNSVIGMLELMKENDVTLNYLEQLKEVQNLMAGLNAAHIFLKDNEDEKYTREVISNYIVKVDKLVNRMLEFAL